MCGRLTDLLKMLKPETKVWIADEDGEYVIDGMEADDLLCMFNIYFNTMPYVEVVITNDDGKGLTIIYS